MFSFKQAMVRLAMGWLLAVAVTIAGAPQRAFAGPAILFDVDTGTVLYAEEPDRPWHPASVTKIMTAYLAFRALADGRLAMTDKIKVSELAHKQVPSKIGLPVGAEMALDLALRSLIIKSANDVAVMIAEAIDGSVEAFSARMNATAKRLGMTRSNFVNPNGLPDKQQIVTARDLAILTRAVFTEFPQHAHYWATATMRIGRIRLRSHNSLLRTFAGATGVKTGFICDSGFNIVASAKREGRHLAAVVLGEVSPLDRGARASELLQHGFDRYDWKIFFKAPKLGALPLSPQAETPPPSIRSQIRVWDCGGRRRVVRRKPKAKVKKTLTAKKQPGAPKAAAQSTKQ